MSSSLRSRQPGAPPTRAKKIPQIPGNRFHSRNDARLPEAKTPRNPAALLCNALRSGRGNHSPELTVTFLVGAGSEEQRVGGLVVEAVAERDAPQAVDLQHL